MVSFYKKRKGILLHPLFPVFENPVKKSQRRQENEKYNAKNEFICKVPQQLHNASQNITQ